MPSFSPEDVITTLYWAVHGRAPDESGFVHWVKFLTENPEALEDLALAFFHSEENEQRRNLKPDYIADHSEYREYAFLLSYFMRHGSKHKIVVDVGAHGREGSNSFDLLHTHHWKGILIEASPERWKIIEKEFHDLDFELVRCGVSDTEGRFPFYLSIGAITSSLDEAAAKSWGPIRNVVEVEARKLGTILTERNIPHDFDVLSVDIEGFDVRVLNNLIEETAYKPSVVIIETSMGHKNSSMDDVPFSAKVKSLYRLAHQTWSNMILTLPQNA